MSHKTRDTHIHTHPQTCVRVYRRFCPSTIKLEFLVQTVLRKVKLLSPLTAGDPEAQRKRECLRAHLEGRRQGPGPHQPSPRSPEAGQRLPTEALWGNTTSGKPCRMLCNTNPCSHAVFLEIICWGDFFFLLEKVNLEKAFSPPARKTSGLTFQSTLTSWLEALGSFPAKS